MTVAEEASTDWRARIGAVAVEDEGVYVAAAHCDEIRVKGFESKPKLYERPKRYDRDFIAEWVGKGLAQLGRRFDAVGVSMFGQIEGQRVTAVPRADWPDKFAELNFETVCRDAVGTDEVYVIHDSTASAVGEYRALQLRKKLSPLSFVRIRVGTGVGVGTLETFSKGATARERAGDHPESGHCIVPRPASDREFVGTCRRHGDCIEGLISEAAILKRGGAASLSALDEDDPVWILVADYLGSLCVILTNCHRPDMIVISGRTMIDKAGPRTKLFAKIRDAFKVKNHNYPNYRNMRRADYISEPFLYDPPALASLLGAAIIARREIAPS